MNIWLLGGFAGIVLLVVFLTQPIAQGGPSNLFVLTNYGDNGIATVIGVLVVLIIAAFVMAFNNSQNSK